MEQLIDILKKTTGPFEEGWLYLPEGQDWDFKTLGLIIDTDKLSDDEVDENEEPIIAQKKGLVATLDSGTIENIVSFAKNLDFEFTDDLLFESFIYYYKYDAFLPHPGFKPLPPDEYQNKMDRDFYDCLGAERSDVKCKNEECQRGAIKSSMYCRVHHFEMIKKKDCPFSD